MRKETIRMRLRRRFPPTRQPESAATCTAAKLLIDGNQCTSNWILKYPYGSRSLSLQVEAVRRLFPSEKAVDYESSLSLPYEAVQYIRPQAHALPHNRVSFLSGIVADDRQRFSATSDSSRTTASTFAPSPLSQSDLNRRNRSRTKSDTFYSLDQILQSDTRHRSSQNPRAGVNEARSNATASITTRARPRSSSNCTILTFEERHSSLTRKPNVFDLRRASTNSDTRPLSGPIPTCNLKRAPSGILAKPSTTPDLNKALPPIPDSGPITSTQQMVVHRQYAPAVTHETITRNIHEIREEHIIRDIHRNDYYHRVLPIINLEMRPTRYCLADDDGCVEEVDEGLIPTELKPSKEKIEEMAMVRIRSLDNEKAERIDTGFDYDLNVGQADYMEEVGSDEEPSGRVELTRILEPAYTETGEAHSVLKINYCPAKCASRRRSRSVGTGPNNDGCFL